MRHINYRKSEGVRGVCRVAEFKASRRGDPAVTLRNLEEFLLVELGDVDQGSTVCVEPISLAVDGLLIIPESPERW